MERGTAGREETGTEEARGGRGNQAKRESERNRGGAGAGGVMKQPHSWFCA